MIDEADEFVAGPQNRKRGHSGDSNSSGTMKRRRSMSPLLRRPQTPPGSPNHVAMGKSLAGVQGQQNVLKSTLQHKGKMTKPDSFVLIAVKHIFVDLKFRSLHRLFHLE